MVDPCLSIMMNDKNEPCVWKCLVGSWKALRKMFIATAKTLGIEVETVEAGDTSQASSLSGAC